MLAKKGKKLLAMLLTLCMVLGLLPVSAMAADKPIAVDKTAEWVDADNGVAKVTLTVDSKDIETQVQTPLITRIVLVMDRSGSMGGNPIKKAKEAAIKFVTDALKMQNVEIAVVSYSDRASTDSGFTSNLTALTKAINGISADGGTNIQEGIKKARELLVGQTNVHNKIMVILSDGEPTYSYTGTGFRATTVADVALGVDSSNFSTLLTGFDYSRRDGIGSLYGTLYLVGPLFGDNFWVTNHGIGTVSEAMLAKNAGISIHAVGYNIGTSGDAYDVMNSVASPDSYHGGNVTDLDIVFEDIRTDIQETVSGTGAVVTDKMGAGFTVIQNDKNYPVEITAPQGVTGKAVKVSNGGAQIDWTLTGGDIKEGRYTLTYYVRLDKDSVKDGAATLPANEKATLDYTDYEGKKQSETFPVPQLSISSYTVNYYFDGVLDGKKTEKHASVPGSIVTVTPAADPAYTLDKIVYGSDETADALTVGAAAKDNVISVYFTTNKYTVTYVTEDWKTELERFEDQGYGVDVPVPGATPTKAATAQYTYIFDGWKDSNGKSPAEIGSVTRNLTFRATFRAETNQYNVTFKDWDGTKLFNDTVGFGADLSGMVPADPSRLGDAQYTYTFSGWKAEGDYDLNGLASVQQDMVFTAQYSRSVNQYEITTSIDNGGTITHGASHSYGSNVVIEWTPAEGYRVTQVLVDGVEVGADGSYTFSNLSGDHSVEVFTEQKTYSVIFQDYDGTVLSSDTGIAHGDSAAYLQPADPQRESTDDTVYTFAGWIPQGAYTLDDLGNVTQNMTFKADYTDSSREYTVIFYQEDGRTVISSRGYNFDESIVVPDAPGKASTAEYDYEFAGWRPAGDYTTDSAVAGDMSFTASYSESLRSYQVKFVVTGGPDGPVTVDTQTVAYGGDAVLPSYTAPEGYTFNDDWSDNYQNITGKTTVTATMSRNEYDVTFWVGDQQIGESQTVKHGDDAVPPSYTVPTGQSWSGWAKEEYQSIIGNTEVRSTLTPIDYTITYYVDGVEVHKDTYHYQDPVTAYEYTGAPEGYEFLGWTESVPETMPANNVVINGSTKIISYTVTFKVDGTTVSTQTVNHGQDAADPVVNGDYSVPEGHTLSAWDREFTNIIADTEVNATLSVNSYKLIYYVDGTEVHRETLAYGADIAAYAYTPADPSRQFDGWKEQIPSTMPAGDLEIHGATSTKTFTVKFFLDGKQVGSDQTVAYGAAATAPELNIPASRNWSGWDKTFTDVRENLNVHSTTSIKTFTVTFLNGSDTVQETTVEYGEKADKPAETPVKASDGQYSYTFDKWVPKGEEPGFTLNDLNSVKQDMTFEAAYTAVPVEYTLSVSYVFPDGQKPAAGYEDYSKNVGFGAEYSVTEKAAPAGYYLANTSVTGVEGGALTGQMPAKNVTVVFTYAANDGATVTVKYLLDGAETETSILSDYVLTGLEGQPYDVTGKVLTGEVAGADGKTYVYTRTADDAAAAEGILSGDKTIRLYYTEKGKSVVTIQYLEDGTGTVLDTYTSEPAYNGTPYNVTELANRKFEHYTFARLEGETEGVLTGNVAINVYYEANSYEFRVDFINDYTSQTIKTIWTNDMVFGYGHTLTNADVARALGEEENSTAWQTSEMPSGYHLSSVNLPLVIAASGKGVITDENTGAFDASAVTNVVEVHYNYTETGGYEPDPTYRVTVKYLEKDTKETLAPEYQTGYITSGSAYDVSEQAALQIDKYKIDSVDGETSGEHLRRNLTITVWYVPDATGGPGEVEIPDGDTPTGDLPELPGDSGEIEITEPETPTSDLPELPDGGESEIEIVDGGVPMGNLPQTGTVAKAVEPQWTLGALALMASMAAAGLAVTISRKKEEEAE